MREYTFTNLPDHDISIPFIADGTVAANNCFVLRNLNSVGTVRLFSPVSQNLSVILILYKLKRIY